MSVLISSLSEPLIAQVVGCQIAHDVWLSFESSCTSVSQVHVIQTQLQLASFKKGSDSISNYFRRAKILADTMAIVRRPLPPFEFVPYLPTDLGIEYDAIVSSVTTRMDPISLEELLGHLLAHEARLLPQFDATLFHIEASTNFTGKTYSPQVTMVALVVAVIILAAEVVAEIIINIDEDPSYVIVEILIPLPLTILFWSVKYLRI